MRYGDSISASVTSATLAASAAGRFTSGALQAGVSRLDDGTFAEQGALTASVLAPAWHLFRGELAVEGQGSAFGGSTNGEGVGLARLHVGGARAGAWIGAGAGAAFADAVTQQELAGDAGAWLRMPHAMLELSASPRRLGDSLSWTDAEVAGQYRFSRVDLAASAGVRAGDSTVRGGTGAWGNGSVSVWLTNHVALLASGGSYPLDPAQGFPGGTYGSLAIHFAMRGRAATPAIGYDEVRERPFEMRSAGGGALLLRMRLPGALHAEIMGDFTDWTATPLHDAGNGWWEVTLPVPPGLHHVVVRTGDAWAPPAGLGTATDEFGDAVGVLVVE